jgi:hypothetical protein
MFMGALNVRFATAITVGKRIPLIIGSISNISAKPWLAVAVNVLAPAAAAPHIADAAECSDSTSTITVSSSPFATISDIFSGMCVDGVIGYIGQTCTLHNLTANATACDASTTFRVISFQPLVQLH